MEEDLLADQQSEFKAIFSYKVDKCGSNLQKKKKL